jgi:hypothetical protein
MNVLAQLALSGALPPKDTTKQLQRTGGADIVQATVMTLESPRSTCDADTNTGPCTSVQQQHLTLGQPERRECRSTKITMAFASSMRKSRLWSLCSVYGFMRMLPGAPALRTQKTTHHRHGGRGGKGHRQQRRTQWRRRIVTMGRGSKANGSACFGYQSV